MPKRLSEAAVKRFHEHGYHYPLPVLAPGEMKHYQDKFLEFEAWRGGVLDGQWRNKSHLFLKWLDDLVRHPAILDAVEDLIGPDLFLWHAQWFVKEPHTPDFVSYHQDSAYWELERPEALSVWIAFWDSDRENGCMEVVADTHKVLLRHLEKREKENMLWRGQTVAGSLDPSKVVAMPLKAGEASIHHARIVHGSKPNHSGRRRIGYSARYVAAHVKRLGARDSAMLVRGADRFGHFDHEPRPKADYDPDAIAFHAKTTERYIAQYLNARVETETASGGSTAQPGAAR